MTFHRLEVLASISAPFRHGYADDKQALADALVVGTLVTIFVVVRGLRPQRTFQLL